MSKHTFTPGPWTYSRWDQFGDVRFYVAQADGAQYTPNYSDVASLIAESVASERVAIQEANARLIASAPELLAALEQISRMDYGNPYASRCADVARAAIARATGGEE
jgi:hypothetical protein